MTTLFDRCYRLVAWRESIPKDATNFDPKKIGGENALEIAMNSAKLGHDIKFTITSSLSRSPNQCDIEIINLSDATRADLETLPLHVEFAAGYADAPRLMFVGDVRYAMTESQGEDVVTLLQVSDGSRAYAHARVNKSYASGVTVRRVLEDAARTMGLVLPKNLAADAVLDTQYASGIAVHGPTRDLLTATLASFGYSWSMQGGRLVVLRDEDVSSTLAIPIDEENGMIGSPHYGSPPRSGKPPHVNVKLYLCPEIVPGALVKLTSKRKNGFFRVEHVRHTGDTRATGDGSWTTEAEIKPVSV